MSHLKRVENGSWLITSLGNVFTPFQFHASSQIRNAPLLVSDAQCTSLHPNHQRFCNSYKKGSWLVGLVENASLYPYVLYNAISNTKYQQQFLSRFLTTHVSHGCCFCPFPSELWVLPSKAAMKLRGGRRPTLSIHPSD